MVNDLFTSNMTCYILQQIKAVPDELENMQAFD
jgi:hypothetical protein